MNILIFILKKNTCIIKNYFDPKNIKTTPNIKFRAYAMAGGCAAIIFFILLRYAWLSFFPTEMRQKLISTGSRQFDSSIVLSQPRAMMIDRNGRPLAVSVPSTSIFLLVKRMPKDRETIEKIAKQLDISFDTLKKYTNGKKNFIWLKRQLSYSDLQKLGNLKQWQDFIGTAEEPKRVYPEKDIASHLIGFVGSEGIGLEGLEKIYNERLKSNAQRAEVMRDARGSLVITTPNAASKPDTPIPNLQLSIDVTIQEFTQVALKKGVLKAKAKGGSAIVMDVKSGEILSIASYPTYDLNNPPEKSPETRRFRPVMDAIELGSVVKPMWIAKALDLGVITPETRIYGEKGSMKVPGGVIHDTHKNEWMTPEEILKVSSNIGSYKVAQKIGRDEFYKAFMQIGFGRQPGTGLPGEWGGRIQKPESWREMRFANMAFGQGFAISPLQLIHGLSIIVGGGVDHGVNLIKVDERQKNEVEGPPLRYISPQTSKIISSMMASVVEEPGGTGALARIPGVFVAGKTGTAQIWSQSEKSYSGRTPVFEGIFPVDDPKIAIVVVLDEAAVRPASGGPLAGPVFAEIGSQTIDYLNSKGVFSMKSYNNIYTNMPHADMKKGFYVEE
jgi:cell division protein FtsI (penicillin-binding protein 3)